MTQISFSTIWSELTTDEDAKEVRQNAYNRLRELGYTARRSVLKNQLRKWSGLGIPDGRSCNVYMITTNAPQEIARQIEQECILEMHGFYADQKYAAQIMSR